MDITPRQGRLPVGEAANSDLGIVKAAPRIIDSSVSGSLPPVRGEILVSPRVTGEISHTPLLTKLGHSALRLALAATTVVAGVAALDATTKMWPDSKFSYYVREGRIGDVHPWGFVDGTVEFITGNKDAVEVNDAGCASMNNGAVWLCAAAQSVIKTPTGSSADIVLAGYTAEEIERRENPIDPVPILEGLIAVQQCSAAIQEAGSKAIQHSGHNTTSLSEGVTNAAPPANDNNPFAVRGENITYVDLSVLGPGMEIMPLDPVIAGRCRES